MCDVCLPFENKGMPTISSHILQLRFLLFFFAGSILHKQLKDVSLWSKMSFVNLVTLSSSQIQREGASYRGCNKREQKAENLDGKEEEGGNTGVLQTEF